MRTHELPLQKAPLDVLNLLPESAKAIGVALLPKLFALTDLGNAERLVARHRDQIRYCPQRKRWLTWDGRRWAWDETAEIMRLAKATVRAIYGEAEACNDDEHRKRIARHAKDSEKAGRLQAMISLAESESGMPVLPQQFDADPWAFNVKNGTIDLRTGNLREHRRDDLITKLACVEYLPGARHDLWDRFLDDATGGDAELAAYLQRAVGYALQGNVSEKCFWFLYGKPDGMKSTFIESVSAALGEYAAGADFTTWLVQTNTGGNRGDLVALLGRRLVCSVEVRKGAHFDEAIIKRVTGGDEITAAAKYEAEITFRPNFALWLAANDAPAIRDDDEGAWSRVRRVPFNNSLPPEKRDPQMRAKLRAPEVQQAILAWAVRGCLDWQQSGLGSCAAVDRSSAEYRDEMDRIAGFFAERCRFDDGSKTPTTELRMAYEQWCKDSGVRQPATAKEFGQRLADRGCEQGRSGRARFWRGVSLLGEWESLPDDE